MIGHLGDGLHADRPGQRGGLVFDRLPQQPLGQGGGVAGGQLPLHDARFGGGGGRRGIAVGATPQLVAAEQDEDGETARSPRPAGAGTIGRGGVCP